MLIPHLMNLTKFGQPIDKINSKKDKLADIEVIRFSPCVQHHS